MSGKATADPASPPRRRPAPRRGLGPTDARFPTQTPPGRSRSLFHLSCGCACAGCGATWALLPAFPSAGLSKLRSRPPSLLTTSRTCTFARAAGSGWLPRAQNRWRRGSWAITREKAGCPGHTRQDLVCRHRGGDRDEGTSGPGRGGAGRPRISPRCWEQHATDNVWTVYFWNFPCDIFSPQLL